MGKNNWLLQYLKFGSSFWEQQWEGLFPFSWIQLGGGHRPRLGQLALGMAQQQGLAFLFSIPDMRKIMVVLGEGRAVEEQQLQSLCTSLPIETASLTLQASPSPVTGTYLNPNHSQVCHPMAEEMAGYLGARIQFCASCWEASCRSTLRAVWGLHIPSPCAW